MAALLRSAPAHLTDPSGLLDVSRRIAFATASEASTDGLEPLSEFLSQVREALGMDVAFIARFSQTRRHFQLVSVAPTVDPVIAAGDSDLLSDTYCQLVVEGRVPPVITDTAACAPTAALPITETLQIRSYISARVRLRDGTIFGTLCCFSHATRPDLQGLDAATLQAVADAIAADLDRNGTLTRQIWSWG